MAVYAQHYGVGFGTNNLGSAANLSLNLNLYDKTLLVLLAEAFQVNSHSVKLACSLIFYGAY